MKSRRSPAVGSSAPTIDYADLVRRLRQQLGMTQEQLAQDLGVTFGTINGWEAGRHRPMPALGRIVLQRAAAAGVLPQAVNSRTRRNGETL